MTPPGSRITQSTAAVWRCQSAAVRGGFRATANRSPASSIVIRLRVVGSVPDVVDARADVDERVEARMARHVFHALAIDVDDAAISYRTFVLPARSDHREMLS